MTATEEQELVSVARRIASGLQENIRQQAYAIISLFTKDEGDLKQANSIIAANKVIYIKVLLALGKEEAAINSAKEFRIETDKAEIDEVGELIAIYLIGKGRIDEARNMLWKIDDTGSKSQGFTSNCYWPTEKNGRDEKTDRGFAKSPDSALRRELPINSGLRQGLVFSKWEVKICRGDIILLGFFLVFLLKNS